MKTIVNRSEKLIMKTIVNRSEKLLKRIKTMPVILGIFLMIVMISMIPTFLLDALMILNIMISIVILIMVMFAHRVNYCSKFPSILLVITLFKFSINIASTISILMHGQNFDSKLIYTFGDFLGGENYIVAFVMFIFLLIAQLMIISGDSRRSELVFAYFTIKNMPGEHMAVDRDLQDGLISNEEAMIRHKYIKKKHIFFKEMASVSKFVQRNAMFGFIITSINIVGGILIGVFMHGESISGAMQIYSLFTIGDGIAFQLPTLLISIGAGLIAAQYSLRERMYLELEFKYCWLPLAILSALMLFLSFIPGMPNPMFRFIGFLMGTLGWVRYYASNE